jgi:hypothetical protein
MKGAAIMIEGDNQGAISAINHFRSPVPEINGVLQEMFKTCADYNADVIGKWVPRENLTEADALSQEPDTIDWGISESVFIGVCDFFGCLPDLDMFASHAHHTVSRFVSEFFSPGCVAVNALKLDWSEVVQSPG